MYKRKSEQATEAPSLTVNRTLQTQLDRLTSLYKSTNLYLDEVYFDEWYRLRDELMPILFPVMKVAVESGMLNIDGHDASFEITRMTGSPLGIRIEVLETSDCKCDEGEDESSETKEYGGDCESCNHAETATDQELADFKHCITESIKSGSTISDILLAHDPVYCKTIRNAADELVRDGIAYYDREGNVTLAKTGTVN